MTSPFASELPWMLATTWFVIGAGIAWMLATRGHAQEVALTALVAWPFLIPSLTAPRRAPLPTGPHAARIDRAVDQVRQALTDADAHHPATEHDLTTLAAALHAADARIGRVDRLLSEPFTSDAAEVTAERQALTAARDAATGDLDAVLAGLAQLRLQVGRLTLAGDTTQVGSRLGELRARVQALGELA